MASVAEFIELRKSIEALAGQIIVSVEHKALQDSKKCLEEANGKLEILKTMVCNDVQVTVADRLTRQLTTLGTKVEKMAAKMPVRKTAARKKQPKKD